MNAMTHRSTYPRYEHSTEDRAFARSRRVIFAILLVGSLLVACARVEATSLVALVDRSNNRLIIAADCRVNRDSGSVSKCKIIVEPDCVAAIAGLYEEEATGFQLRELVHTACQEAGNLRSTAEAFLRISRKPYERAVRSIRDGQPGKSAQTVANKPTEVVFAGIQNGHIALFVRGLVADSVGNISVERFESTAPSYGRTGFFLGLNGHIRAYMKAHPNCEKEDYAKAAHQFVEMEIEAHPDLAGQPISEVEVDEEGHLHWLAKGVCVPGKDVPDGSDESRKPSSEEYAQFVR
jgi:hypothetical protein